MNNEIKEILDNLKKTADNTIFVVCGSQEELDKAPKYTANFLSVNDRQAKILLDYITNLQEENKELNDDNIWWNNRFKAVQRNYKDYKLRNEKAIEHLKEVMKDEEEYEEDYIYNKYLLDILQGVDKE